MAIFEPTNYVRTDTTENPYIVPNLFQKKTGERRSFLRTEVQGDTALTASPTALLFTDTKENRNRLLTTVDTQQSNGTTATSRRGIEIYRRNNELNSRTNEASDQNAATFQLTFSGILSQQQAATTSVNTRISENTQTLQQKTTEQSTGLSLMNRALQQYQNLQFGVKNITDLLNRGIDVYQKTLKLAPALTTIPQSNAGVSGQSGIEIPQTMNTINSNGIAEYLIFNSPAEKNTNSYDLYLKAGPMRMLETQLFI